MVKWNGIKTYTLTWTEQVQANLVAPDTDTIIPIGGARRICCQWDTNGADTGSPDFDFHLIASIDGTTFGANVHKTLASAVAKDVVGIANFVTDDWGPAAVKGRLDVNTADLAAGESVTLTLRVYW